MRIYWDQILVDTSGGNFPMQLTRLDPSVADLRWRGFSLEHSPDGRQPLTYDYKQVSFTSPWKVMTGRYTREGDVRELLLASDDMFVISRPGDEIVVVVRGGQAAAAAEGMDADVSACMPMASVRRWISIRRVPIRLGRCRFMG